MKYEVNDRHFKNSSRKLPFGLMAPTSCHRPTSATDIMECRPGPMGHLLHHDDLLSPGHGGRTSALGSTPVGVPRKAKYGELFPLGLGSLVVYRRSPATIQLTLLEPSAAR